MKLQNDKLLTWLVDLPYREGAKAPSFFYYKVLYVNCLGDLVATDGEWMRIVFNAMEDSNDWTKAFNYKVVKDDVVLTEKAQDAFYHWPDMGAPFYNGLKSKQGVELTDDLDLYAWSIKHNRGISLPLLARLSKDICGTQASFDSKFNYFLTTWGVTVVANDSAITAHLERVP